MDAELHFADETHAIGSVGHVFINVVRKPATLEMLRETRRQVQRHFRRCNNVSVALSVLVPGAAQSGAGWVIAMGASAAPSGVTVGDIVRAVEIVRGALR